MTRFTVLKTNYLFYSALKHQGSASSLFIYIYLAQFFHVHQYSTDWEPQSQVITSDNFLAEGHRSAIRLLREMASGISDLLKEILTSQNISYLAPITVVLECLSVMYSLHAVGKCYRPHYTDGELRHRGTKWVAQSHTGSLWKSRELNSRFPESQASTNNQDCPYSPWNPDPDWGLWACCD